jgi:hypothetical protein
MIKIGEKLLKGGGVKLYIESAPTIFGTIKIDAEGIFEIKLWYKSIFQNLYHEDSMSDGRIKLKNLLINAHKQYVLDEKNILTFSDWKTINE